MSRWKHEAWPERGSERTLTGTVRAKCAVCGVRVDRVREFGYTMWKHNPRHWNEWTAKCADMAEPQRA